MAEDSRARYALKRDERIARAKEYIERNKGQVLKRKAEYRAANRDKIRAYRQAYRQRNLNAFRRYDSEKRARKRTTRVAPFTRDDILARDGNACYLCGIILAEGEITLEHVIPLARGGSHTPDNVRVACKRCNFSKGTKTPEEFLKWKEEGRAA